MKPNAFFPSLDLGTDPAKIRDWAQAAEDLGYAYIEVPDHVFGAKSRDNWVPLYNEKDPFHETFVTLGFLAAATKTIGLSTGILIAPQRQTGVIAKQAAEVDILSGGRLRLGIGGMEPRRIRGARCRLEDARSAPGRTGRSAPSSLVGGPRELHRTISQSPGRQHSAATCAATNPDLVWRFIGRCRHACRQAGRWLDANHGSRRAG